MFSKWKVLFLISNISSILTSWHFTIKKSFHFSPTYLLICLCQCEFIDFYSLSCPCYYLLSYSHFPGFGEAELPVDLAHFCRHHLAVFPSLKSVRDKLTPLMGTRAKLCGQIWSWAWGCWGILDPLSLFLGWNWAVLWISVASPTSNCGTFDTLGGRFHLDTL